MPLWITVFLVFGLEWLWPIESGPIAHDFDAGQSQYGPGHRGIDLVTRIGAPVLAAHDGTVFFVGEIDSVPVLSINHGDLRSTYQPVRSDLQTGDRVQAGQVIGTVSRAKNHCAAITCLHFGVKRQEHYLDPLDFLGTRARVVLISPDGPPPGPAGPLPVNGVITSEIGWRIHPITKRRSFHDGIDIAAPCGTAVRSMSTGRVRFAGTKGGYGKRIEITGSHSVASYSHLSTIHVRTHARVLAGQIIGRVGSTGVSTGCHLHYTPR